MSKNTDAGATAPRAGVIRRGSVSYRRAIRNGWRPLPNGRWLLPVDVPPRIVPYDEALRFADIQMAIERV